MTALFRPITLPDGGQTLMPADVPLVFPAARTIPVADQHYLAYIPWQEQYLLYIPRAYRRFFRFVLPCLGSRTSDVHTALSVAQLPQLLAAYPAARSRIVYLATILHDVGWSEVDQQGLVDSLSYSSVKPAANAKHAKRQHLIYGEALAYRLLEQFDFDFHVSDDDAYYITEIIRRHDHDQPWEAGKYGEITLETKLVCDADRLWSYTHENFWQDTVRKGVDPAAYWKTLHGAASSYFFTPIGKSRAHALLRARAEEVSVYRRNLVRSIP